MKIISDDVSELTQSRRSSPEVIEAVNRVFLNAHTARGLGRMKSAVEQWQQRFSRHSAFHAEMPGHVTLQRVLKDEDRNVREFAAEQIAELVARHPDRSIGVLVRTNKIVNEMIFNLSAVGVKASEEGGNPLMDSAAVGLIASLLHLVDHPGDQVALFHVLNSPLHQLFWQQELSWDQIEPEHVGASLQRIRQQIGDRGLAVAIEQWANLLRPQCTPREFSRLNQLVTMAFAYADKDDNPSIFRARIENSKVDEPTGADVRVMTIHQAKGLEFDIVVLPHLDCSLLQTGNEFVVGRASPTGPVTSICKYIDRDLHSLLPAHIQKSFEEHLAREISGELCLLYVAMTRARHALHMFVSHSARADRKQWQGLLLSTLANNGNGVAADERMLWSSGDPDWNLKSFEAANQQADLKSLIGHNVQENYEYNATDQAEYNQKAETNVAVYQPFESGGWQFRADWRFIALSGQPQSTFIWNTCSCLF